jgi:large subunit ribosomal protein L27
MAHKKGAGSTKNGRDSNSQRLGVKDLVVKKYELEIFYFVKEVWNLSQAQMLCGKDFTLFALTDGVVKFDHKDGKHKRINIVV